MFRRLISIVVLCTFLISLLSQPGLSLAADAGLRLPEPGTMVNLSPAWEPVMMKGLKIDPKKPFNFEFVIDPGNSTLTVGPQLKDESDKLIKYFLASLTIPEKDLWVNLSPYEKDHMIADNLAQTEMGRDMLAQDYILKQLTASLIYPEKDLGKSFWDKVYTKAQALYGTTTIPVNTFNKVWIVADKADVFEKGNIAYIVGAHLKVMLEEDYLSKEKHQQKASTNISSQIIKEIVLPELEKEINYGKNFAPLRQMFYSMILASWYKMALKDAVIAQVYGNKSKVKVGVNQPDPKINNEIFNQYIKAYKKGVFNYIKEDIDKTNQQPIPRKYFSGGEHIWGDVLNHPQRLTTIPKGIQFPDQVVIAKVNVEPKDEAMSAAQGTAQVWVNQFPPNWQLSKDKDILVRYDNPQDLDNKISLGFKYQGDGFMFIEVLSNNKPTGGITIQIDEKFLTFIEFEPFQYLRALEKHQGKNHGDLIVSIITRVAQLMNLNVKTQFGTRNERLKEAFRRNFGDQSYDRGSGFTDFSGTPHPVPVDFTTTLVDAAMAAQPSKDFLFLKTQQPVTGSEILGVDNVLNKLEDMDFETKILLFNPDGSIRNEKTAGDVLAFLDDPDNKIKFAKYVKYELVIQGKKVTARVVYLLNEASIPGAATTIDLTTSKIDKIIAKIEEKYFVAQDWQGPMRLFLEKKQSFEVMVTALKNKILDKQTGNAVLITKDWLESIVKDAAMLTAAKPDVLNRMAQWILENFPQSRQLPSIFMLERELDLRVSGLHYEEILQTLEAQLPMADLEPDMKDEITRAISKKREYIAKRPRKVVTIQQVKKTVPPKPVIKKEVKPRGVEYRHFDLERTVDAIEEMFRTNVELVKLPTASQLADKLGGGKSTYTDYRSRIIDAIQYRIDKNKYEFEIELEERLKIAIDSAMTGATAKLWSNTFPAQWQPDYQNDLIVLLNNPQDPQRVLMLRFHFNEDKTVVVKVFSGDQETGRIELKLYSSDLEINNFNPFIKGSSKKDFEGKNYAEQIVALIAKLAQRLNKTSISNSEQGTNNAVLMQAYLNVFADQVYLQERWQNINSISGFYDESNVGWVYASTEQPYLTMSLSYVKDDQYQIKRMAGEDLVNPISVRVNERGEILAINPQDDSRLNSYGKLQIRSFAKDIPLRGKIKSVDSVSINFDSTTAKDAAMEVNKIDINQVANILEAKFIQTMHSNSSADLTSSPMNSRTYLFLRNMVNYFLMQDRKEEWFRSHISDEPEKFSLIDLAYIGHRLNQAWRSKTGQSLYPYISLFLDNIQIETDDGEVTTFYDRYRRLSALTSIGNVQDTSQALWVRGVELVTHLRQFGIHAEFAAKDRLELADNQLLVILLRQYIPMLIQWQKSSNTTWHQKVPAEAGFKGQDKLVTNEDLMLWGLVLMLDPLIHDFKNQVSNLNNFEEETDLLLEEKNWKKSSESIDEIMTQIFRPSIQGVTEEEVKDLLKKAFLKLRDFNDESALRSPLDTATNYYEIWIRKLINNSSKSLRLAKPFVAALQKNDVILASGIGDIELRDKIKDGLYRDNRSSLKTGRVAYLNDKSYTRQQQLAAYAQMFRRILDGKYAEVGQIVEEIPTSQVVVDKSMLATLPKQLEEQEAKGLQEQIVSALSLKKFDSTEYGLGKIKEQAVPVEYFGEPTPEFQLIELALIRVGDLFLIDQQLYNQLDQDLKNEYGANFIIIPHMKKTHWANTLSDRLKFFTLTTILALRQIDFKDKRFVDMGAGDGILSVVARKLGAKELVLIDNNKYQVQGARELLLANGIQENEQVQFIQGDILKPQSIISAWQSSTLPHVVAISIGTWPASYGQVTNLSGLKLLAEIFKTDLKQISNIILSGYMFSAYTLDGPRDLANKEKPYLKDQLGFKEAQIGINLGNISSYIYEPDKAETVTPGGIDFDLSKMQLNVSKEGNGVNFKADQAIIDQIKRQGFDGLEFTIQTLEPVTNLPQYLGITLN